MLQNLLNNKLKVLQIIVLVILLALIRGFENELFYDPFLDFFKSDAVVSYPVFEYYKLFFSLFFRYFLNSIISLAIIYIVFSDIEIVKFSGFLYIVFFIVLSFLFYVYLNFFDENHKMILFYIRRFLIQPLFLLLFVAGFYYQKKIK